MNDLSPEIRYASRSAGERAYRELLKRINLSVPTEALPPTRVLRAEIGVSLGTLRRALLRLVAEGRIYALGRRGFFVDKPAPAVNPPAEEANVILYANDWEDSTFPYYVRRMQGLMSRANELGLRLEIQAFPLTDMRIFSERREFAGLVLPYINGATLRAIRSARPNLPIVLTAEQSARDVPYLAMLYFDVLAMGTLAGQEIKKAGARRIACLSKNLWFTKAVAEAAGDLCCTVNSHLPDFSPEKAARAILDAKCDALACYEDRIAAPVLQAMIAQGADLSRFCIVSHANYGDEQLLPASAIRLVVDGFDMGVTTIDMLRLLQNTAYRSSLSINITPHLVYPGEREAKR